MVNAMLSNSDLSHGFWGEAVKTACYILNRVSTKRQKSTIPYELWNKRKPNLSHLKFWGCRAVVKVSDFKRNRLREKCIECIFIGYASNSNTYRFMVIEPNDHYSVNTMMESRDAVFDENHFTTIPRPRDLIVDTRIRDHENVHGEHDSPSGETSQVRKSKRA
ncbi:hypothetical protein LIER_30249 [Lithospermum erythrorhizon]|uniref:Retroviral polymerase SH3-like domain-containing protein n=1 Tax=Lithospermum erythrorhizon TaxID=34254 RepID=A0AAV3RMD2_LITER